MVLTPEALRSKWVVAEIQEALALAGSGKLRIVPILLRNCEVPEQLAKLDYADFRDKQSEAELDRLVRSIDRLLIG